MTLSFGTAFFVALFLTTALSTLTFDEANCEGATRLLVDVRMASLQMFA